ncbi:DUF4446 family protein [Fimbriimonas ginsengisoli]|nr:DUF4446 family protein [Fimbriimonas ginsengisoli]
MLVLFGIVLVLVFALVRIAIRQSRHHARWRELLKSENGESLESLLLGHLRERVRMEQKLAELEGRSTRLENALAVSKRHLGLVRYDAFDDVGGNQSFTMAVYDDAGNGAVLTSIIGRTDCRVYCKPLVNGRSERDLSQEEQRAIREAKAAGPKPILSPE